MNSLSDEVNDDVLPSPLDRAVACVVSAEPDETAMNEWLQRFEGQAAPAIPSPDIQPTLRERSRIKTPARWWFVTVASLAVVVGVVATIRQPSANAWELVARALQGKSCIKMTTTTDGKTNEHWLILDSRQSAWRNDEWIEHYDSATDVVMTFDREQQTLVRSEGKGKQPNDFLQVLVESLASAGGGALPTTLRGNRVLDSKLVDLKETKELTVLFQHEQSGHTGTVVICLDKQSDLPQSALVTASHNNQLLTARTTWEYPEHGPTNIYSLGVEPDTELVDRIPPTDVKRLVAGVYAGRTVFDDYRAVVIKTTHSEPTYYGPGDVMMIGLRGDKLVFLRSAESLGKDLRSLKREEVASAILANPHQIKWHPIRITHGQASYMFETEVATNNGQSVRRIASVRKIEYNGPRDEFITPSWRVVPHFAGRPPLGIGRADISAALATEAEGGPEDCVLLQTNRSGRMPVAPSDDKSSPLQHGGYWIRANRDYLVIKQDSEYEDGVGNSYTLTKLAQSPRGQWYPTEAFSPSYQAGQQRISAQHYSYHLDFEQLLPETAFDPESYLPE